MASSFTCAFAPWTGRRIAIHCTLLLCSSVTTPALGSDRSHRTCAIPVPLKDALYALGDRTGTTLIYDSQSLPKVNVCPAADGVEIATGLKQMLAGTGLIAIQIGARAYDLRRAPVIQRPAPRCVYPATR